MREHEFQDTSCSTSRSDSGRETARVRVYAEVYQGLHLGSLELFTECEAPFVRSSTCLATQDGGKTVADEEATASTDLWLSTVTPDATPQIL